MQKKKFFLKNTHLLKKKKELFATVRANQHSFQCAMPCEVSPHCALCLHCRATSQARNFSTEADGSRALKFLAAGVEIKLIFTTEVTFGCMTFYLG